MTEIERARLLHAVGLLTDEIKSQPDRTTRLVERRAEAVGRLLSEGVSLAEIARTAGCSRASLLKGLEGSVTKSP